MSVSTLEENTLKDIPQQLHLHQGHSVCPKCCSVDIWLKQHETAEFFNYEQRCTRDFHDWIDEIKHCSFFVFVFHNRVEYKCRFMARMCILFFVAQGENQTKPFETWTFRIALLELTAK